MDHYQKNDRAERASGLGRITGEETGTGIQMTDLIFLTGTEALDIPVLHSGVFSVTVVYYQNKC